MVQSYNSGRAQVCQNISGLDTKHFYNRLFSFVTQTCAHGGNFCAWSDCDFS